jgi:hypothetical protein
MTKTKIANQQQEDAATLTLKSLKRTTNQLYIELLGLARNRSDSPEAILNGYTPTIAKKLATGSAITHQRAEQQALEIATPHLKKAKAKKLTLSEALGGKLLASLATKPQQTLISYKQRSLSELQQKYLPKALQETTKLHESFAKAIKKAIQQSVSTSSHTQESIQLLKESLGDIGLSMDNNRLYETIVRTELHSAYTQATLEFDNDPAIQEILWGYEFNSTLDERLRDSHEEENGKQAPKDDPIIDRWRELLAEYNCRCQLLQIFNEDKPT